MKLPNTIISLILNKNDEKEWEKLYFLFQDEIEWKINHNKFNIDISKFIKSIKLTIDENNIYSPTKEYILNENNNVINYKYYEDDCIKGFNLIIDYIDPKLNKENIDKFINDKYDDYDICDFEEKNKFYFSKRVSFNKKYYFKINFFIKSENEIFKSIKYEIKKDLKSLKKNPKLYKSNYYYRQQILDIARAIRKYFDANGGQDNRIYYEFYGDPYDGLNLSSRDVRNFALYIIFLGKYDEFCKNPFNGNIFNYASRGVSCGNSSCLYLDYDRENIPDLLFIELSSSKFVNKIFDIIHH